MASVTQRLLLQSRRCASSIPARSIARHPPQWPRPLSTTASRCARPDRDDGPAREPEAAAKPVLESTWANTPDKAAAQLQKLAEDLKALDPAVMEEAVRKGKQGIPIAPGSELVEDEDFEILEDELYRIKSGFWAEGEESMGPDEDYYGDDITSHGHGELQKHRELREYARLIAWELPLLSQLARPFEPPTASTPFRFRYTSYLGESHPAANKVVVEFSPSDLGLAPTQRDKLIKLSGPRYNPSSDLIKMSTEQFDTQTQNKRFLGETIQSLIAEAKDSTDTFQDVPFDFRHHRPKLRHAFPPAWALTPERKAYLAQRRADQARLQDVRAGNGQLIDGKTVVDTSLPFLADPEPVLVQAPRRK
ncbi:37S ribosomal protein S24, mitochondrial [Ascochyta rabiei]|uniref:Uncharacterized protein n=1 Tax=Didymella rabiei TaxID=5454 RepID=A0A163M861_DIDRA|nr:37S ribosomal protein S24, mitochondrial [Ascochyta rabiei]KZM28481.1 hypothetical protein ST47_g324 [Ascochyta rabiei]UPX15506.1 37S ribosomal protein S24, mitochondrial [Ascochyta rabiei]